MKILGMDIGGSGIKAAIVDTKTGELIYIPEKNKVRFKASKFLKKFINE